MNPPAKRPIFRQRALEHHRAAESRVVLPKMASVNATRILWVACIALLGFIAALSIARIPVYTNGPALVLPNPQADQAKIAVFLQGELQSRISSNTPAELGFSPQTTIQARVVEIRPQVYSVAQMRSEFNLDRYSGALPKSASTVVILTVDDPATFYARFADSVGDGKIQIGTRRVLTTLFPMLGGQE